MLPDQETKPKIKFKTWIVLAALAITGQIAWAVETPGSTLLFTRRSRQIQDQSPGWWQQARSWQR